MSDILPEPTDTVPEYNPDDLRPTNSLSRQTIGILIGLVIIALLALLAGYSYDYNHNHDQDNTRKQDLAYIAGYLNSYYDLSHYYPTLAQLNSNTFGAFAPNLNKSKFKDPSSNITTLSASPTTSGYAYQPTPEACNNKTEPCTGYKLVAILSNGKDYVVSNPKPKI